MGTWSRWHHERAPHLSQFLNPLHPQPKGRTTNSPNSRGGFPPQKVNMYVHPVAPIGVPTQPLWGSISTLGNLF